VWPFIRQKASPLDAKWKQHSNVWIGSYMPKYNYFSSYYNPALLTLHCDLHSHLRPSTNWLFTREVKLIQLQNNKNNKLFTIVDCPPWLSPADSSNRPEIPYLVRLVCASVFRHNRVVYHTSRNFTNELRQRLVTAWKAWEQHIIRIAVDQWRCRQTTYVSAKGSLNSLQLAN